MQEPARLGITKQRTIQKSKHESFGHLNSSNKVPFYASTSDFFYFSVARVCYRSACACTASRSTPCDPTYWSFTASVPLLGGSRDCLIILQTATMSQSEGGQPSPFPGSSRPLDSPPPVQQDISATPSQTEDSSSSSFLGSKRLGELLPNATGGADSLQQPANALGNVPSQPHIPDLTQVSPEVSEKSAIPAVMPTSEKFSLMKNNPGYKQYAKWAKAYGLIEEPVSVEIRQCEASMLPEVLHGKEKNAITLYPDHLADDTHRQFPMNTVFAYRGADRPTFATGRFNCAARHTTLIKFHDAAEVPNLKTCYGAFHVTRETPRVEICLEVPIEPDTQTPPVVFVVKRSDGSRIWMVLAANDITASDREVGQNIHGGAHQNVQEGLPDHAQLREAVNRGQILRVGINRKPGNEGKGVWSSNDTNATTLVGTLTDHAYAQMKGELGGRAPLDIQDMLIALLDASRHISVYISTAGIDTTADGSRPLQEFAVFMRSCFWAAARRGNFWWYKIHESLYNSQFLDDEGRTAHPRWLIEFFDVSYDIEGSPIACTVTRGGAGRRHNRGVISGGGRGGRGGGRGARGARGRGRGRRG